MLNTFFNYINNNTNKLTTTNNIEQLVIKNNIKNIIQKITLLISFVCIFFLSISLLVIGVRNRNISIENKIITDNFKEENARTISKNTIIDYFINQYEKMTIYSKYTKTLESNLNIMKENKIITPHIRNKIYIGNTDLIQIYGDKNYFVIPNEMLLSNQKVNYIHTQELQGNFYDAITSKRPFKINDDDLFLSGDDLYFIPNKDYLRITQNTHLIKTKIDKNNNKKKYDIRSQQMEYIGEQSIIYFIKNIFFNDEENFIECQFSKVFLDKNNEIEDLFLQDEVKIIQKTSKATADYGFFDKKNNLVLLYKNVILKSKDNVSKTNIYIYNTEDKTSISINEYTPLTKREKQQFYGILIKLSKEIDKKEKQNIENFIKVNKKAKIETISSSDNSNVNREKRAKIRLEK